jgi:hypothetical protein
VQILLPEPAIRRYNNASSLTDLDNGDLKQTTDFRDVCDTVHHGVFGTDPAAVLGNHQRQVDGLLTT